MGNWILKVISLGRPGTKGEGLGWDGKEIEVDGEPVAVIEDRSRVRVYVKKQAKTEICEQKSLDI
jgi:hypothetical protein